MGFGGGERGRLYEVMVGGGGDSDRGENLFPAFQERMVSNTQPLELSRTALCLYSQGMFLTGCGPFLLQKEHGVNLSSCFGGCVSHVGVGDGLENGKS